MEDPPKKFFRLSPGKEVRLRCAYFITCTEVVKDDARRDRRAALHLRSGDARRRRAGRPARQGDAALGVGRARGRRSRCGSTIGCSRSRIPSARPRARRSSTTSTRTRSRCCATARSSRASPAPAPATRVPVRAARLFLRRSGLAAGRARLQPHRVAARHLGEDRAEAAGLTRWNITSPSTTSSRARSKSSTSRSSSASSRARRPPPRSSAG